MIDNFKLLNCHPWVPLFALETLSNTFHVNNNKFVKKVALVTIGTIITFLVFYTYEFKESFYILFNVHNFTVPS